MITSTERLIIREFELSDSEFIRELLNDPDWIRNIGQRNVHSTADAEAYIQKLKQGYKDHGFGFYAVIEKFSLKTIGMCGLIKRAELEDVDLGFAFLPEARGKGYAQESSRSIVEVARKLGIKRLLGILDPKNLNSARVLEKIGMTFERKARVRADDIELLIYGMNL